MDSNEQSISLPCAFCGAENTFLIDEIYDLSAGKEVFREKFCLTCGEPLTLICPSCNMVFRLDLNFEKQQTFKIHENFWDPTPSLLDSQIPDVISHLDKYSEKAQTLNLDNFRLSQKDFLALLPEVKENLTDFEKKMKILQDHASLKSLQKDFQKIIKSIDESLIEMQDIMDNIEKSGAVNEKKDKLIKKRGLPFLNFIENIKKAIIKAQEIRKLEILSDKNKLKPGYDKIKGYILQDPEFYKLVCPVCNTAIYNIKHQIYDLPLNADSIQFIKKLPQYYQMHGISNDSGEDLSSKQVSFQIIIFIDKGNKYELHGNFALILTQEEKVTIGRNFIRDIEFEEDISEDILFDEDDPLARVSNSQITLELKNNNVLLTPMKFDDRRVGTFLNTPDYDVRIKNPEGIELKPGDKIIIPLISEPNNPNRMELTFKS
ncbi:MAG: hypothetical protein ACTSWL_10360 [Promethearchaeota archaeon]